MNNGNFYLQYGKALYFAAAKNNAEEDVLNSVQEIVRLSEQREFAQTIAEIAHLQFEELKKILKMEFEGKIHPLALNLLILLVKNKHFRLISKVFEAYKKAYYRAKDIVEVTVRTAKTCDESTKKLVENTLLQKFKTASERGGEEGNLPTYLPVGMAGRQAQAPIKKNLRFHFEEDNGLIGGLQIYESGYVVDYSIKNYLENLQKYLLKT